MMIVITGVDKTGKSTLSRKLVALFGWNYMHFSKPPVDAVGYFGVALKGEGNIIVDRWIEGDAIYAKVCGHKRRLSKKQHDILLKKAIMKGLIYIFCHSNPVDIKQRFKQDKEKFLHPKLIKDVQNLMLDEAMRMASLEKFPVFLLDNFKKEITPLHTGGFSIETLLPLYD